MDPAEETEEDEDAENPSDRAFIVPSELVLADVRMERASCVPVNIYGIWHQLIFMPSGSLQGSKSRRYLNLEQIKLHADPDFPHLHWVAAQPVAGPLNFSLAGASSDVPAGGPFECFPSAAASGHACNEASSPPSV